MSRARSTMTIARATALAIGIAAGVSAPWATPPKADPPQAEHAEEKLPDWLPHAPRPAPSSPAPSPGPWLWGTPPPGTASTPSVVAPTPPTAATESTEPSASAPEPFRLGRLFSARFVSRSAPPRGAVGVDVGVHFRVAPIRALAKSALEDLKAGNPDAARLLDLAAQVDADAIEGASDEELLDLLTSAPGATAQDVAALSQLDLSAYRPLLSTLVDVAKDPEDAVAFALIPYLGLDWELLHAELRVPLAGFSAASDATFELGNITLDLRLSHHFGADRRMGVSVGTAVGLPTAHARVSALVLTNALDAPLFLDPYLAFEPYAVWGVDLEYVLFQVDLGISALVATSDASGPGSSLYLRYGFGCTLTPGSVVALTMEVVGGVPLRTAELFDTHLFTAGLRFDAAGIVQPGLAVQLPLSVDDSTSRFYGGLPFGSPASVNVMAQLDASF